MPPLRRFALPALAILSLSGCLADESFGKSEAALSQAGPWDIPEDTLATGDTQSVTYTGAGPWVGPSGCGGSFSEGGQILREWLEVAYPQISHIGGYSCRPINGNPDTMSVHATGRALDIHIPLHEGDADNDLGDPLANWLIEHSEEIGIQLVIWDRWSWGAHRAVGNKERAYTGAHPHHDHLHVELSLEAARAETPWFSGAMAPPDSRCPDLGPDGGTIEETGECFAAYGPSQYWRTESVGHGGSMRWTNAFEGASPSNWARWLLTPTTPGDYRVEVYAEPQFSVHTAARYSLQHGGQEHELTLDLSGADGWTELGVFHFDAAGGQSLSVYDNSPFAVGSNAHIPADAVRLTRIVEPAPGPDPDPDPDMDPTPGPRVIHVEPRFWAEAPAIEGGDPALDDDPRIARPGGLTSGCSVGATPAPASGGGLLLLLGVALRIRRRR